MIIIFPVLNNQQVPFFKFARKYWNFDMVGILKKWAPNAKNDVPHPSRKVGKGLATLSLVTLANTLIILKPRPHNEMFISTCDIACGIDEPIWHIISNTLLLVIGKEEKWRNKKHKMQDKDY